METSPVLHEKWSNSENMDLPKDQLKNRFNMFDSGSEWRFYKDSTFNITFWRYTPSIGYRNHQSIAGRYEYKPLEEKTNLTFDSLYQKVYDNRQVETPYYVVQNIKRNFRTIWDDEVEYSSKMKNITLQIVERGEQGRMWVHLFAYDEKREVVSFDTIVFVREELED